MKKTQSIPISVPTCVPDELKEVLKTVATEWGNMIQDKEEYDVLQLGMTLTNKVKQVFEITWPTKHGEPPKKVLIRLYMPGFEMLFFREHEIYVSEYISNFGRGPKLRGRFSDGRIEEFIHARTLSAADLRDPEISDRIAAKLREFHVSGFPKYLDLEIIWDKLRRMIVYVLRFCSVDAEEFSVRCLNELIDELEERCLGEEEEFVDRQEICFCHNDLRSGNILMDEETRAITLINHEYATLNPIAYDIGNFFCEMGANYESSTSPILESYQYPGLEQRRRFVYAYLRSRGEEPSCTEAERVREEAEKYTLVSHLYWVLWGIITGEKEYAKKRYAELMGEMAYTKFEIEACAGDSLCALAAFLTEAIKNVEAIGKAAKDMRDVFNVIKKDL